MTIYGVFGAIFTVRSITDFNNISLFCTESPVLLSLELSLDCELGLRTENTENPATWLKIQPNDTENYFLGLSASVALTKTSSIKPYFFASSALINLSRSVSAATCLTVFPVCLAYISFKRSRIFKISWA